MTSNIRSVQAITPASIGGLQIQRVKERIPHFNMMIYGDSGVGKTFLAGSAYNVREMRRVLYIDIEGGFLTLRKNFPNIETVRVEKWKEMQGVYDHLRAGGHGFQTVLLDSLTEIQKFNMDEIMKKLVDANEGRDEDVPSLREWGKNLEQTRRFVRAFRDLPLNVVFTALRRVDKDRMGRPINLPSLSGKMAMEVAAFLDIVLYYSVKEDTNDDGDKVNVRVLQSAATESTVAKDRSGLLPAVMVAPTMEQLFDLIIRKTGGTFAKPEEAPKETATPLVTDAVIVETETEPKNAETKNEPKKVQGVTDEEVANLVTIKE